jgi:amino acid transporter
VGGQTGLDPNLEALGYKPQLRRVLTRADLILYGLVILTPTAAYPVFGIVQHLSNGHAALSYLVAMAAMLFTAASYGRMAGAYPAAGSTYTYAQRALNPHIGFLAGWSMILDYVLIPLLSVVYVALTAARLLPGVHYLVWAVLFTALITFINLRGIRTTAWASRFLMVVMMLSTVLFIGLATRWVVAHDGVAGLIRPEVLYDPRTFSLGALMLGAGIATLSYIGFDAISTLAEETRHPERDIAFATVLVCVLQTVFCFLTVYLAALVWPKEKPFPQVETAILDISRLIGGEILFGFVTFVLLVAGIASALAGQAGASRLLFGMGRDGVLPRRFFGYVDPKRSVPARAVWFMGVVAVSGSAIAGFQLVVELLNFGAFVGFILVNLSVIRHYFIRQRRRSGTALLANLIAPGLGALACTYVWLSLSANAKLAGFVWLGIGLLYLAILTRGFRISPQPMEIA